MRPIAGKLFLGVLLTLCSGYLYAVAQESPVLKVDTLPQQSLSLIITNGKIQNFGLASELILDLQSRSYEPLQRAVIAVYLYRNSKLLSGEGIPVTLPANNNVSETLHPHFAVKQGDHILVLIQEVKSAQNDYSENPEKITKYLKSFAEHTLSASANSNSPFLSSVWQSEENTEHLSLTSLQIFPGVHPYFQADYCSGRLLQASTTCSGGVSSFSCNPQSGSWSFTCK